MILRVGLAALGATVTGLTAAALAGEVVAHGQLGEAPASLAAALVLACVGFSWCAVGVYLVTQRHRHPLGWLFAGVGLAVQAGVAGEVAGRAGWLDWTGSVLGIVVDGISGLGIFLLIGLLPLVYPEGRIRGRAPRVAALLTIVGALLCQVQVLRARVDPDVTWPFGPEHTATQSPVALWLPWAIYAVGVVAGWVLCTGRLVRAGHPLRQQLAWLLVAVVAVMGTALLGDSVLAMSLQAAALLLLPVAIAVGIVRYQLLDIDTVVPQALTAGVLGAAVVAVYLVVAALSGAGLTGATLPSLVAAALVAAVLLPLQTRVRRLVDRVVYGARADPIRAVTDLGAAVSSVDDGDMLAAVLAEVASTFRARGARVRGCDGRVVAASGDATAVAALSTPLQVSGEDIGALELSPPSRGGRYSRDDAAMLGAFAGTVALAVRAAALADALEEQRDAVVEATTDARERLRRDLHDGLGPSLTGLRLGLRGLADAHADGDRERARQITSVLHEESDRAVAEVRRVIDALRPIDLDDSDLAAALRQRLGRSPASAPVTVDAHDVPRLLPMIEDGVFRVVTEAVANAHRHADAGAVGVHLSVAADSLVARVTDDGVGFPAVLTPGVGLASMRARAAEFGGTLDILSSDRGTDVTLTLPLATDRSRTGVAT